MALNGAQKVATVVFLILAILAAVMFAIGGKGAAFIAGVFSFIALLLIFGMGGGDKTERDPNIKTVPMRERTRSRGFNPADLQFI